jgi:hypothetical protein
MDDNDTDSDEIAGDATIGDEMNFFAKWPAAQSPSETTIVSLSRPVVLLNTFIEEAQSPKLRVRRTLGGTPFSEEIHFIAIRNSSRRSEDHDLAFVSESNVILLARRDCSVSWHYHISAQNNQEGFYL